MRRCNVACVPALVGILHNLFGRAHNSFCAYYTNKKHRVISGTIIKVQGPNKIKNSYYLLQKEVYVMFIVLILLILSFIICTIFIRSKWKFYAAGLKGLRPIDLLRTYNILSQAWPCDDGFMSLIFSALRHTLIPIIFAFLIWFINSDWLNSLLLFASLIYALSIIPRYKERKKDFISAGEASQDMLKPIKSACFSVILCAFVNYLILLLCYCLRLMA